MVALMMVLILITITSINILGRYIKTYHTHIPTHTYSLTHSLTHTHLDRYHRQTQIVSNASAALNTALSTTIGKNQTKAITIGIPLAHTLTSSYTTMVTMLLEYVTTPGTLGMIGAHEGANWPSRFGYSDARFDHPFSPSGSISKLAEVLEGGVSPICKSVEMLV